MPSLALVSAGTGGGAGVRGSDGAAPLALVGTSPGGEPVDLVGRVDELVPVVAELDAAGARFAVWSFGSVAPALLGAGVRLTRLWDLAEVHRILHGGWAADPARVWAVAAGLDPDGVPAPPSGDLFDLLGAPGSDPEDGPLVREDGYLRGDAGLPARLADPVRVREWARAALACAGRQREAIARGALPHPGSLPPAARVLGTAYSESATALLAAELEHDGLPLDRAEAERVITVAAGPRPTSEADARRIRAGRDAVVLRHLPEGYRADLRNPASVRTMLDTAGVRVESTRKWELEGHRDAHPVVGALLAWRADERIATTYGHRWLAEHVGPDDRLRGAWSVCDGGAGRMTAQSGLHSLPSVLRSAVAAEPGHVLVRADLGQIEPRVLAVVSGDRALAAATTEEDLYAPVAARLGVERAVAKVAVLAAMYGQRSGSAGEALRGLERAYPVSMSFLDRAYEAGRRGEPVRTYGGRLIRTAQADPGLDPAMDPAAQPAGESTSWVNARGRFARNAVIQGSAAELFKAWAATVRATTRDLEARIVLCLHDELLVHVREEHAEAVAARVHAALTDSARRWVGPTDLTVRFVADLTVVRRWSEAKD